MSNMIPILVELQRLKRLDRTGWILRGLPNGTESVASHSFGVGVTAMLLADELIQRGVVVNVEKVLRMALLHDWAEVRVGDLPGTATEYFGAEVRKKAETAAFRDIVNPFGQAESLYTDLYVDYERRGTLEARLVKMADIIDLLVEALALERAGVRGLDEFWEAAQTTDLQVDGPVRGIITELFHSLLNARSEIGRPSAGNG
jgi:5'-deoxynucleotidase YfbR-like HD superfamily hydrolase